MYVYGFDLVIFVLLCLIVWLKLCFVSFCHVALITCLDLSPVSVWFLVRATWSVSRSGIYTLFTGMGADNGVFFFFLKKFVFTSLSTRASALAYLN